MIRVLKNRNAQGLYYLYYRIRLTLRNESKKWDENMSKFSKVYLDI